MAGVNIAPLTPISLGGSAGKVPYWDSQQAMDPKGNFRPVDAAGNPQVFDGLGQLVFYGEGPTYLQSEWETIFFDDVQLPGLCEVDGAVQLKIDKKKPPGSDGIELTSTGLLPGPVDITLTLWTLNQWLEFQKKKPLIWVSPDRGWPVPAVAVSHPAFNLWDINLIVIENVSVPKRGPIPQTIVIKLRCQHWVKPTNKNRTATVKSPTSVIEGKRTSSAQLTAPSKTDTGPRG